MEAKARDGAGEVMVDHPSAHHSQTVTATFSEELEKSDAALWPPVDGAPLDVCVNGSGPPAAIRLLTALESHALPTHLPTLRRRKSQRCFVRKNGLFAERVLSLA